MPLFLRAQTPVHKRAGRAINGIGSRWKQKDVLSTHLVDSQFVLLGEKVVEGKRKVSWEGNSREEQSQERTKCRDGDRGENAGRIIELSSFLAFLGQLGLFFQTFGDRAKRCTFLHAVGFKWASGPCKARLQPNPT